VLPPDDVPVDDEVPVDDDVATKDDVPATDDVPPPLPLDPDGAVVSLAELQAASAASARSEAANVGDELKAILPRYRAA
jgi:hypothetical protein